MTESPKELIEKINKTDKEKNPFKALQILLGERKLPVKCECNERN